MRLRMVLLCFLWCLPLWSFSAPLPDNQVFQFSFSQFDANTLKLDWTIKEGYFLYREHIWIENSQTKYLHIGVVSFPDPETKVSKQGKNRRETMNSWEYINNSVVLGTNNDGPRSIVNRSTTNSPLI